MLSFASSENLPAPPSEASQSSTQSGISCHTAYRVTTAPSTADRFLTIAPSLCTTVPSTDVAHPLSNEPGIENPLPASGAATSYTICQESIVPVPPFASNTTVYRFAFQCAYSCACASSPKVVLSVTFMPPLFSVHHPVKPYPTRVGSSGNTKDDPGKSEILCVFGIPPFASNVTAYALRTTI